MNEKICILAVCASPYCFDKDGKHMQGISHKAVIGYYVSGEKLPRHVEIVKMPSQEEIVEKVLDARGKYFDGVCMFDRFGRFLGISG